MEPTICWHHSGALPPPFRPTHAVPRIKQVVESTRHGLDMPAMAAAAQAFVQKELSMEALRCYWYCALAKYGELYYAENLKDQTAAEGAAQG